MSTDLPRNALKLVMALLKHQTELWLGKETVGIAGTTLLEIGGETALEKVQQWLESDEVAKQLIDAAQSADDYLRDPRHCPDPTLHGIFTLGLGSLPSVQKTLLALPNELSPDGVRDVVAAILADPGFKLTEAQIAEGARLYTDALLRALGPVEKYARIIVLQVVLANSQKLDELGISLNKILDSLESSKDQKNGAIPAAEPHPADLPPGSHLPFQRNPLFTGREQDLETLAANLAATDETGSKPQIIAGMGGIGKTQMVVEFAYSYKSSFPSGIHWISATGVVDLDGLTPAIVACGHAMHLPGWPEQDSAPSGQEMQRRQRDMTLYAWRNSGPRLVIVDNVENPVIAQQILRLLASAHIQIVLTTRISDWPVTMPLNVQVLKEFAPDESLIFLRKHLPPERASDPDLRALAIRLGHLPLALELAGRYLARIPKDIATYVDELNLFHPSLSNWRTGNLPSPTEHEQHVANTFAISWSALDSNDPARAVFILSGYFAPGLPIPMDVLGRSAEMTADILDEALLSLRSLALLKEDNSLHPLMAEFSRAQNKNNDIRLSFSRALAACCHPDLTHGGLLQNSLLAQHAKYALNDVEKSLDDSTPSQEMVVFIIQVAYLLRYFGNLKKALYWYQRVCDLLDQSGDKRTKAAALSQIAHIYRTQGNLEESLKYYEESITISAELDDKQGISTTLHEIAGILILVGDFAQALETYRHVLAFDEMTGNYQGQAATLFQMGFVYHNLEKLDDSLNLYSKSMQIKLQMGNESGIASNLRAMAETHIRKGNLKDAFMLIQRALEISEKFADQSGKAAALHVMASIYFHMGNLEQALDGFEQSLSLNELIGDLRSQAATLNWIAIIERQNGNLERASAIFDRTYAIAEQLHDAPSRISSIHNKAGILSLMGDDDGALQVYEQCLEANGLLGDQRGKAAAQHEMANIYLFKKLDIPRAEQLLMENLKIFNELKDPKAQAITLPLLGLIHIMKGENRNALHFMFISLQALQTMGAAADAQTVIGMITTLRNQLGSSVFDPLWVDVSGGAALPEWLKQDQKM